MKRVTFYLGLMWRPVLSVVLLLSISTIVLFFNINLPGSYSGNEAEYLNLLKSQISLPYWMIFLPINLVQIVVLKITTFSIENARYVSATFGLSALVLYYSIIRQWYTTRVAILSAMMFLTSTWFLVVARSASPIIAFVLFEVLILITIWLQKTKKTKLAVTLLAISCSILIYIPGMIWMILGGLIWKRKFITNQLQKSSIVFKTLLLVLVIASLTPIAINYRNSDFLLGIMGLPKVIISFQDFLSNIYYYVTSIFWNSSYSTTNVGNQGLLDIFVVVLFISGFLYAIKKRLYSKYKFIFASILLGVMLVGLNGQSFAIYTFPGIMILVAIGLAWIIQQWFTVFPKNPVAKFVGICLIFIVVLFSSAYNTYRYFIAWPHMDSTKSSYTEKL
ncbi:hypothetical protein KDA00_05125 [Candidatus Saccharibacteria bacterium]|nr:hypothetical protein [Candidatus Saccharibacteria bacterium]